MPVQKPRGKQLELGEIIPVGTVFAYAGSAVPTGWLDCDGSAVSRTTYADLFAAIGTAYGVGDGSTTFNLPDFRSRSILGAGAPGGSLTTRARGDTGGAETHTLDIGETPVHDHGPDPGAIEFIGNAGPGVDFAPGTGFTDTKFNFTKTASTGGGGAHNNVSPFGVTTQMIFANA
jgi:microcystin-dependent protein